MVTEETSVVAILERLVVPMGSTLRGEVVLRVLDFSSEDHQRMQVLAAKARLGTLTAEDRVAIESYERVGHYLSILQSKVCQALRQS
jgi:hypothetical protein